MCQARHSAHLISPITSCAEFHSPCPHPAWNKVLPIKPLPWEKRNHTSGNTGYIKKSKRSKTQGISLEWNPMPSAADMLRGGEQNQRRLKEAHRPGLVKSRLNFKWVIRKIPFLISGASFGYHSCRRRIPSLYSWTPTDSPGPHTPFSHLCSSGSSEHSTYKVRALGMRGKYFIHEPHDQPSLSCSHQSDITWDAILLSIWKGLVPSLPADIKTQRVRSLM